MPTLRGQGEAYLLHGHPGPAASRLQTARRAFPKDDLLFRDYLYAKCWEQGAHRTYAAFVDSDAWPPLAAALRAEFGIDNS